MTSYRKSAGRQYFRFNARFHVSSGVEKLRKRMGVETLTSLGRQGLIKTRRRIGKRKEVIEITLTKKGVRTLRQLEGS